MAPLNKGSTSGCEVH